MTGQLPETETVRRFVWQPLRQPPLPATPSEQLAGRRIAVIGGQPRTAAAVSDALRAAAAVIIEPDTGEAPDGIVDLGLDEDTGWEAALLRSVRAVRECYDTWSEESDAQRVCYVAVTYFGGGMGYRDLSAQARPFGGLWAGLAKTLHHELPNCNTKVIDVDPAAVADLPDIVGRELYRWGAFEVGYRDGVRHTLVARREDVAAATVDLGPEDVVLISGGGRGIGFALATHLAEESGCRVVVTGRHALPASADLTPDHERKLWDQRHDGRSLADIRRELTRIEQGRQLGENLRAARDGGLRIDYEVCDFTDRGAVRALVDKLGPELAGVIHNAGVDMATRLHKMSDADVLRTVRTKVDGFTALFDVVRTRQLKFFCNVGSLSGRLSGMVGQIAYAAANDGLARLGLWARERAGFPVMTLCWPVWERLGLITNYEAALRYMAPLAVPEGLRRWRQELLAPTNGEAAFLGVLGDTLTPVQVRGFPLHPEAPGYADIYPRVFHLGTPLTYRPGGELVARVVFDAADTPALTDFEVNGHLAVPVSLLLENALASAAWVGPRPTGVRDLRVRLDGLVLDDGKLELVRSTRRSKVDGLTVVDVRFTRNTGDVVAELRLVHTTGLPAAVQDSACPAAIDRRWRGVVFPVAGQTGEVREPCPDDLWTLPVTPPLALPLAALENVVRSVPGDRIRLAELVIHGKPATTSRISAEPAGHTWVISDPSGDRPVLTAYLGAIA